MTPRVLRSLVILTLLVWIFVAVQEYRHKQAWREKWLLDTDGNPVKARIEGRVWELGKGYRAATEEETRDAEEHERGRR